MKVKVFSYQGWAFTMFLKSRIPTDQMELEIQEWRSRSCGSTML